MPIQIFNTYIDPKAFEKIKEVLETTFLSEGKLVKEFEDKLAATLSLKNPVAVNSGTSALHLALVLAGIQPGDEVILPAQTFVATGTVVLQEKAVPVFADINYEDGNIDPASIEKNITEKTKAIMAVHWAGYPCDMDAINLIAKKHNLKVIEDAAHALGATYKSKAIGTISDYTCFSFQAIKHLTTGDGGALCLFDDNEKEKALARRWFGIDRANSKPSLLGEREYDISEVGYKYHLNDYAAALGLANLENFPERLRKRQEVARIYNENLKNVPGLKLFNYQADRQSTYWLFGIHVENRDNFILALKDKGIATSVIHQGIDRNAIFGGPQEDLVNQIKFNKSQIHIPIYDGLSDENVHYIIETIKKGW